MLGPPGQILLRWVLPLIQGSGRRAGRGQACSPLSAYLSPPSLPTPGRCSSLLIQMSRTKSAPTQSQVPGLALLGPQADKGGAAMPRLRCLVPGAPGKWGGRALWQEPPGQGGGCERGVVREAGESKEETGHWFPCVHLEALALEALSVGKDKACPGSPRPLLTLSPPPVPR